MSKEANIIKKTQKPIGLLYRKLLMLCIASAIVALYMRGRFGGNSGATWVIVSVLSGIMYAMTYYFYKVNGDSKRKNNRVKFQTEILVRFIIYLLGIGALLWCGTVLHSGRTLLGICLTVLSLGLCQCIYNNKKFFSHLSSFCESAAPGLLVCSMGELYSLGLTPFYALLLGLAASASVLHAVFYHIYIVKEKKTEREKRKQAAQVRKSELVRDLALGLVTSGVWAVFVYSGWLNQLTGGSTTEKISNIIAVIISVATIALMLYDEFFKKPKEERMDFKHKMDDKKFRDCLQNNFGEGSLASEAFELVKSNMCAKHGFTRYNGDDFYVHPQAVAEILMEYTNADMDCIIVALLHDCIEDLNTVKVKVGDKTVVRPVEEYLRERFGDKITDSILLLSKKEGVSYNNEAAMREYLDGILEDKDATLVKLADRMNNNSTLFGMTKEKKQSEFEETQRYYVPFVEAAREKYSDNGEFFGRVRNFFDQEPD